MVSEAIIPLTEARDVNLVGGKAKALGELRRSGFNVPDGFVVTTLASKKMTNGLKDQLTEFFRGLAASQVAVRSSAISEDGANDAWAGQMDTFLNVDLVNLPTAVKGCWDSANSPRARAYAKQKDLSIGKVAVLVQTMVHGDVSGVAFSVHPVTQNSNHMIIEAVPGLADSLVSGEVTPDSYVIDKRNGKVIEESTRASNDLLSYAQITKVTKVVGQLEQHFRFPVDVEWTIAKGKLFVLQSRPITTLG